jgi:hypothetical protein
MSCFYPRREEFNRMMDRVGLDVAEEFNGEPVYIAFSGGIDSTVTLLSLLNYTSNIILFHYNLNTSKYARTLEAITDYFCDTYHLEKRIIPTTEDFYSGVVQAGIKRFVFSDGFDIAYGQIYKQFKCTEYPYGEGYRLSHGERFRCSHPYLDILLHLKGRLQSIHASKNESGADRLMSSPYNELRYELRDRFDLDVIDFDSQPGFIDFFDDYQARYLDVVYRKQYNEYYVKDALGISYLELVRMICVRNGLQFSFWEEVKKRMIK